MKVLYFDCFSGVAGDMVLGALLDLGVDFEAWRRTLHTIPVHGFRVERSRVVKGHIACTHVDVEVDETGPDARAHRHLADVVGLVQAADLPGAVKARAEAVFRSLAGAEARVHDATPDTVRFHEVGAVDAIVDVVGACLALHDLGVDTVHVSPVTVGRTRVDTAHGMLPTPAPATLAPRRRITTPAAARASRATTRVAALPSPKTVMSTARSAMYSGSTKKAFSGKLPAAICRASSSYCQRSRIGDRTSGSPPTSRR